MIMRGGMLGVMTQPAAALCEQWWHHRDLTPVVFYPAETFEWLASHSGFKLVEWHQRVVLLGKR
jgi:hypothetical protein